MNWGSLQVFSSFFLDAALSLLSGKSPRKLDKYPRFGDAGADGANGFRLEEPMPSSVFFAPARGTPRKNKFKRMEGLLKAAGHDDLFAGEPMVAVKVHWGEAGNADFIPSFHIRQLVEHLKLAGARPFVTDTNTLYRGARHNAVDNLSCASANGFTEMTLGCPVVIADGLRGRDYVSVPVRGRHVTEARVASAIAQADALLVVSHVKGHMVFGFGGALKNLGMGCSPAAAKQALHADVRPVVDRKRCTGCGLCRSHCAFQAIDLLPGSQGRQRAQIDLDRCAGCGECLVVCPEEAIPIDWGSDDGSTFAKTQEKTAEYAAGVMAGKSSRTLFVNFLTNITPDCDCCSWSDAPIVPDIGYLVSTDPVAIDRASIDLVNGFTGFPDRPQIPLTGDRFRAIHDIDYLPTLVRAEELGLGRADYVLVEV
jgi:uncharacterized Fe-S center protein